MTTIRDLLLNRAEHAEPNQPTPHFVQLISRLHGEQLDDTWRELVHEHQQWRDLRDGVISWAEVEDPEEPYTGFAKQEAALLDAYERVAGLCDELLPARDITTLTVTEGRL